MVKLSVFQGSWALLFPSAVEVFCLRRYVGVQETLESVKEKILVVDDEASIRRILETRLSMIGYDVVTAADGEEALDTFRHEIPDLVVLDVMMPKLDGYGVCQELRKESDIPIIMLTALGDVADRITGLELRR